MPMDLELPLDLQLGQEFAPVEPAAGSNSDEVKKQTRERFFDNEGSLPALLL